MSYAAPSSPRPSMASITSIPTGTATASLSQQSTPTSSHRPSLDIPSTRRGVSPNAAQRQTRNSSARSALRDYYNLRPSISSPANVTPNPSTTNLNSQQEKADAIDQIFDSPTFDPSSYVATTLSSSNLSALLALENQLVSSIRSLDGEGKALVYDNYSKLISAMETIGRMRANMGENVGPKAAAMVGAVMGGIVDTAVDVSQMSNSDAGKAENKSKRAERDTVRWVLEGPRRLEEMNVQGRQKDTEREWETIRDLLNKWEGQGVKGTDEVRKQCEAVMQTNVASKKDNTGDFDSRTER